MLAACGPNRSLLARAIWRAWACARAQGVAGPSTRMDSLMDRDPNVRRAIVNAWLAGYRCGVRDTKGSKT